ncbi:MAG: nucleotidyltransferase domain-containing protein [Myxococcota bacterium]|nr:nucleotidyltransferase domain-containing protein [Myxococcota bacterium]
MEPSLTELTAALAAHRDVELAVVFGSVARGEAGLGSDVDVAVRGAVDRLALGAQLSRALGREVDVVELDTPDLVLLSEIVRDGRCVAERSPGAYAQFRSHALATLETDLPLIHRQQEAFLARLARAGVRGSG